MTIYQDVELSMTGHLVPPVVHVKQYDHKARKVRCQLYTNSLEYTPPNKPYRKMRVWYWALPEKEVMQSDRK